MAAMHEAETGVLTSRVASYQENLRISNTMVLQLTRERDQWREECSHCRIHLEREKAVESARGVEGGVAVAGLPDGPGIPGQTNL